MSNAIRTVLHAVAHPVPTGRAALPRAVVVFLAAALALFLVWSGWLYPLRPDTIGLLGRPFDAALPTAWGGPTLVGAWAVHALLALGIQAGCVALIRLTKGRAR